MKQALKEVPCHHIDCPALVVLSVLASQKQFGVALAGGAVRDTYFKRPVKDHDIVIWGLDPALLHNLKHEMGWVGYELVSEHISDPEYGTGDCADGRYERILKYKYIASLHNQLPDVDVLIFHERFGSLGEILDVHDHNINQFAVTMDDPARSHVQTAYYLASAEYGTLRFNNAQTCAIERRERMVQYALDVGWKVPNDGTV